MDIKKWIKIQEQEAQTRANLPHIIIDDNGEELDIEMSQNYGDEYFFNLANGDLEKIIPKFDMDSAIYALGTDCIVRLYLTLGLDTVEEMVRDAVEAARDIESKMKDK